MVTKPIILNILFFYCFILAKNPMVTKHTSRSSSFFICFILAKNHMVTKPQIHVTIYLKIIKY